jgi:ferredoxin--NADP+ reductase
VRYANELGYADYIRNELPQHEYIGEQVQKQLHYYPTVTREPFENSGRITDLLASGKLTRDIGLPELDPQHDRVMICGSPSMLGDLVSMLEARGFQEGSSHQPAHYTIERAFVER